MSTRKNKSYSATYRGNETSLMKYGQLYDQTPNLYPLPPIGAKVKVRTLELFQRRDTNGQLMAYRVDSQHRDSYNRPAVFEVVKYTKGIENPMDEKNEAVLQRKSRSGYVQEVHVRTIYVASGSMQLLEV